MTTGASDILSISSGCVNQGQEIVVYTSIQTRLRLAIVRYVDGARGNRKQKRLLQPVL